MLRLYYGLLLSATVFSLASSGTLGRHLSETAATYSISWQPDGRAFAIWVPLYALGAASAIYGLVELPMLSREVLVFWSATWFLSAIWIWVFDNQRQLRLAAVIIVGAFGTSLTALILADAWRSKITEEILLLAPLSLLTGWLLLAASLGIATAVKASQREPDVTMPQMPRREREYVKRVYFDQTRDGQRAKHVEVTTTQNIVVPILALVGGCLAIAIPDPVLTLPLVWGCSLQRGFPRSVWLWLAIGILLGGSAISVLRIFLWEF